MLNWMWMVCWNAWRYDNWCAYDTSTLWYAPLCYRIVGAVVVDLLVLGESRPKYVIVRLLWCSRCRRDASNNTSGML
eukprot:679377-Pyramimonas_sp.AAC.1